jgi:molybdopterin-guanine dinucleotide biosynthesis protein A
MNAFVLAGGQSTRMGRDKAQLELHNRLLIEHALDLLPPSSMRPRICASRPDLACFAEVIPDRFPGSGPLAGIEAALSASDTDLNLFLPVDMPSVPRAFLQWMGARAEISRAVATIPRLGDRPQPLCAVYSRCLLPGLRERLETADCKVIVAIRSAAASLGKLIDLFQMETVAAALPPEAWPSRPPLREWFRNLNTPADFERLRRHGQMSLEHSRAFQ